MTRRTVSFLAILCVMGAGWGMTQPLSKIAVSGGYRHFGLIFWQMAIGFVALGLLRSFGVNLKSGVSLRWPKLRTDPAALLVYVVIALIGTVLPNSASYEAIRHLPSGLISILLSLVPMFALPVAVILGNERFDWGRLAGLVLGLTGVFLIVAPEASLPERAMVAFIPLALIAPLFYALEGNIVDRWGTAGLTAIEALYGASLVGALISLGLALWTGQFIDPRPPWGWPDLALVLASLIHIAVYTTYVWLVRAAGPVFAVQVSYLVTGFGVLWAMWILGESYSGWVWAAMAVILTGVFLVQPRRADALAEAQNPVTINPDTGQETPDADLSGR